MPIDNKKLKNLYDAMRQEGYDQSYDEFRGAFLGNNNYANRKDIYDTMSSGGYNLGKTYAEFMTSMRVAPKQANNRASAQAAAAKSAPTQPTKGGWRPNAEQMAGYQKFTDGVLRTVKNGDDVMNRVNRQVARATRPNQQKVNLGFNNKHSLLGGGSQVQHEGKKFDAAKGDFVDQYSTEAGNVYDNTYEADAEQYNINRNKRDADTLDMVADIERQIREQEELLEKTRKASRDVKAPDNLWDALRYTMSHADGSRLDQEDIDEEAIKANITNLQNRRSLLLHGTSIGQKVGKSIGDQLAEVNKMINANLDDYYKNHPDGGPKIHDLEYNEIWSIPSNPYLDVAKRSLEDAQEMFNEAGKSVGESGLTGFGKGVIRGFGSKLFDARTWDMGYTDLKGGLSLAEVLKKADEGKPLTVEQQKMLDAKATELACAAYFSGALGRGYKAGQVTAESIPFMLEFMLNPLSGTGRSAQAMLTRYALKRFGRKATMELGEDAAKKILYGDIRQLTKSVFDKGLSKGARRLAAKTLAGKASARIAGDITGAAGMTFTTGQGRVAADMLNRATGQVKFGVDTDGKVKYTGHDAPEESSLLTAYGKAFGSQFSENYSEFMGPYISYVGGMFANGLKKIGGKYLFDGLSSLRNRSAAAVMKLPFAPMVSDFIREATKSDWAKVIKGMQKRAHWDGTAEEYLEEVAGNMLNAILVGDNDFSTEEGRGVFNLSDNIDTFLGVGLMSGAMSVSSAAGYRTPAYRARKMVENADARGEKLMGGSLWGKFRSSFDAAQSEQDKQVILTSLLQNSSLTNEGRRAALQYAIGKQFQQAVADGTFREMEEDAEKGNEVERACRAEYAEGQNIDSVEEMRDAKTRYNVLLREALAVEPNAEIYSDPQFYEQSNPNATPEQKAAMRAYAEAKAQYEGVADRMKTDMADQQQKANEQVDRFKNQTDGLITRVRLRGSDAEFYVTSGHISLNNDGTINDAATSSNLTIVDGEGNERFISRGDVVDVLAQNTPEETLEQLNDIIMNEAKAKADLIDGKLSFRAGDTFTILNNEGQEQKVTIAQDPSTMAMSAVIEGEQAAVPLTEDSMAKLQQMSDAYQESRFGKYRQEQLDAVANAENEATQEGTAPASPTAAQEETGEPTEARSYGYGESVSYVDGEGHTQEGVVHGKTPEGTYEVEFDNPPSGKNVVDEYTQEELDALVQPIPAGQTEEAIPEPTALERVPINEETGEPMFEKADSETALDALNEVTGGNEDNTTAIVRAQVEQATKALEALKKKKPSKKAPSLKGSPLAMVKAQQEAEANYNTAMEEYNAQVAAAEENLNAWSRINSLMNDRKRAIREQQEAERKAREEELHAEAVARLEEDKRIAAEKAAEQEAVGTHAVNPKIKAKWDGATKVEGNPNAITLADGSTIRGHYVLTEAGAATASHDVNNAYEPTEGFPVDENGESVNDRDYKRDRDAQRIVRDMADSYDGRALQSPVIVSKDGVVLSGNNRTMSGEIAARQGTDKAYVAHLREFGAMFGFTPEQIDGMQHPRVVFVPDEELPYDANTFARFNAEQQKKQSKPEHAVKLGKIVPDNVFTSIVGDISRFDRMSDYYADGKAAASAISQLLDAGVINEMQLPELRTGNALSAAGKELIENTLIGKVFQTSPDAVRQIISTPTLRQSVVMGLNEIANNRTLAKSGYDLSKELAAAVDLVSRAKAEAPEIYKEGMPVSPYGRQQGLFDDEYGDSRVTDGVTLLLADLLNSGKPSDLRKVLSTYNHEAASPAAGLMDMFSGDVPSKEDVLNNVLNHFRNATPKEQQAIVDAAIAERKRRAEAAEPGGGSQGGEQTENAVRGSEETSAENLGGNQADGIQEKLTEEEADAMLDRMKSIADPMPEVELTPENWMNTFGLSNKIDTPIGEVKMGESQYAKLMEKKRSKEFGMVVGTITDPDVVFIEPSSAKDGQVTERAYSYVFVKTFKKEDENVRYYSSVTVSIDGMEISVSSHYINSNKAKKKLLELNRRYTKTALISNSSDGRLAEQQDAVPDLLPTQENNAVSDLPFPKDGVSVGEDTANSTELQGNGKESSHKGFVPDEKVIEENVQRSERALGLPSSVKREKTEVKVSDNGKVMVIKTDYSANGSKASVITLLAENDGQLDWAAQSFVDGKPTSELKYDYTLSYDDMMEMFDDNDAIRQDINPLKQIARNAGIDIDALLNGKEHGTKVSIEASREKTSENEGEKTLSAQIEDASADVNTEPTEAQKEAGNYKKGHVHVGSFDITIEQPQGSVRKGTDANGKQWESKMHNTYGYFRGTEGVDGDHIDVFLSNDIDGWNRQTVFVVDQYNPDGSFDEHKVMLGFNNAEEAKRDYLANYEKGWENGRRIDVSAVNLADFEKWIASSHRKTKPFSEYSSVKKEGSSSSETKQSKSTAEEKPFNAVIEMLRKKFPDASMEALTAADRLLREQALPGERQKAIEAVAKALGLKVEWRDTMEKENGTFNPKTRTITIARDSEHALANTFGHEVTHAVRKLSEADYKNLKDAVRRLYPSEKEYNEAVQAYGEVYTDLDFDALEEELIADNIGFMIGGRNDMTQELASRMNHRVLWAIHDAMNKVRNALAKVLHIDSKKNGLLEAIDSARATIRETMANAQRIAKEKGQGLSNESDSTKQSLRTQDTTIRDALVERMRLSGMDVITDETGQRVLDMANGRDTRFEAARHKSEAARRRDEMLRAIDQAKAFISGKTEQQTRAERRERERKFREETKVLYDRVLAGNFDSVTLQLLDDFINKVTPNNYYGRPLSKRLSERTLRKVYERERTSSVDALFSRISESAVPADERTRPEAKRRIEEKKKELLKGWAIATGNWHTAVSDFTDDTKPIGSGKDSVVYHSKDGKSVIKVSKGKESARKFRPDMDNVALFNTVFPASKYEIIGYGEIDGKFVRFLRQPIVDFTDSTPLSVEERVAYMERLGFRPMNDEKTAFTNGEIVASDIQGNNIVKDRDGNIRVIDADMRFHTKEFGGKYSYPAVETDTETAPNIREQRVYHGNGANDVRFFRTANGKAYGFTVGGKIYIDPRIATSETPVHEYAHLWATALKSANAKEWQNVVGLMKGTKVWDEVKALYPELKSDDEIADEVLATYSGRRGAERLREEQRRIAKGNGSVFEKAEAISALERVKQALKRFWKGVADFLHIHYTSAEEVADRVMKDLLDGVDPRKFGDGGKSLDAYNKIRKHFIGEQGAERADHAEEVTTRIDNLNVAREMEDAKKDAKAIKMATGWERGADGKWRYEIPDLKYFGKGDAGYKKARGKQPWSKELDGLSDKIFDGEELSESEYRRFDELAQKEDDFKTDYLNREKPHLADWVENDELFKAYPDLKRVNVVFTDQLPTNVGGSYNEREHTIVVNTNYVGDIDSVLAHEVQHAIQKIEGFARGGNPESIQERFKAAKKEWRARAWADELRYKADEMGEHYNQAAVEKALIDEYKEMGMDDDEWMPDKETRMKGFNYFARGYADRSMDADIKNFRLAESTRADFNPYMEYTKLGGEVESRNVEKRMKMSPEERRASLAAETEDVSREDQIFLFGEDGTSMKTSSDLNEMFGNRWLDEQTNDDGRHTTQVKSTINSYKKFGDWVKRDSNGRDVDVLDASSGLGLGTAWMRDNGFKVDDVEPFPSDSREAPTFSSYDEIDKKYDYIISNAVLNVIPDDWRANVLHQMADKLKDGGKLVINVRGAEGIRKQGIEGKTRTTLDDASEILVHRPDGSIKSYQKGFTKSELKEWCEKELGEGYSVEIANNKNAGGSYDTAVVVTKNNESDIETINTKFNEELQQQIDGTLPEGHIYKMGKPGRILLSTGVPNLPIQMNAKRLQVKATLFDHDFDLSEVKDLVRVLQHPLAVFAYGDKSKAQNIIVPLQKDGKNFIVGLSLNPTVGGRKLEINSIRNVFPKDNSEWLNWINQDKALYIDKEKIQTLIDQQRTNLADVAYLDLDSVANVMENFENPKVSDENVADGGIMFRNGGAADAEKQSRRGTPNLYPDHIAQAIYEQSVSGFKFDLDEAWHDSLLSVKRLQEAISETRGVPIRDFENVYWHAVTLSSVNAAEMEQLMNLRIQPFIEAVQDICKKHDLTQEDIEVYLNCKHGLERNEAMARKFAEAKAEEEFEAELKKAQKTATANPNDQAAQLALLDVQLRMNDRKHELYLKNREKDYSGLTDIFDPKDKVTGDRLDLTVSELEDKAKKCVDDFEAKVGVAEVTKLWDNIHELNNYSLRKSYLSGLISKNQYDSVKQMYQWYVPLRGFNEEVAGDVYTYVTRGETRTQQLLKEAKGRTSRAGDILATMMNMANSAVNQGNRNLMKQKILNLALNAKSPLLSVSSTWYQTDANGFDVPIEPPINDQMTPSEQKDAIEQWEDTMEMLAKQGKVHRMSDNLRLNLRTQKWQADEHCIRVQRGGKEYCVWVNGNPRAAQALNDRLGNQVTKPYKATETILDKAEDLFTDGFIKIFRYMAQSVTSLNPEFVISNFQRDLASASLISTGKYGAGYTKDFLVNVKRLGVLTGTMSHKKEYRNAAGIYTLYSKYKSGNLDNNNEMERYFAEFMANGGETGYTQSLSIKDYQSRIQSALGDKGFVKWSKNAGHAVADFVEMANRGVENTCRFAAYMTSRQHGKSVLQSIVDAKEASTNFNLHGAGGFGNAWLRKSIIFINPAVQSIVQYCQLTAKHPKAMLSMLGGTIGLGAAMAFACASMVAPGGGDPDSNYWDLSDYVRHNYIVIPSGNGNWTRIALPPEIRAVYGLGVIAMEAAMGRMNHSSIPAAIGDQLMQFSPVAFLDPRNFFNRSDSDHPVGKTLFRAFIPTLLSPLADAYVFDEDFMGRQITGKNDFNDDKPEFQRTSYDTLPQLVSFSRWLNNISGGNDYKKGWINVNPSSAGYVASQYIGGPLQFFTKIGKTVAMITYEDLRDMRNVPFLSRFMTSTDNDYGRNQVSNAEFKYWSAIADDVRTQIRGFEKEIESGDTKNLDDYKKLVSSKEYEMYQMIDYMDWLKDIRELNQKRKEETTQDAQKQVTLEIYEVRRKMAECLNKAEEMGVYLEMGQLNLELANAKTTEERAAIQAKINEKRKENLKKIGAIE
jgi:hypothetical protein